MLLWPCFLEGWSPALALRALPCRRGAAAAGQLCLCVQALVLVGLLGCGCAVVSVLT